MDQAQPKLSRRHLFAGAGTAGALAAVAAALPLARPEPEVQALAVKPPPEQGGGYQVTQHVLRYYQTTRV